MGDPSNTSCITPRNLIVISSFRETAMNKFKIKINLILTLCIISSFLIVQNKSYNVSTYVSNNPITVSYVLINIIDEIDSTNSYNTYLNNFLESKN